MCRREWSTEDEAERKKKEICIHLSTVLTTPKYGISEFRMEMKCLNPEGKRQHMVIAHLSTLDIHTGDEASSLSGRYGRQKRPGK
jgi:hypothetical protein